jgi:hypothetical protein
MDALDARMDALDARAQLAERQRWLVQTLFAPRLDADDARALGPLALPGGAAHARLGLQAYRSNGRALAARALAAAYPTLAALLGDEPFAALAADYWQRDPPQAGDIGDWGGALPPFVEQAGDLAAWPYLADCARLDWAVHRAARAADAVFEPDSLRLLAEQAPEAVAADLLPGSALLASPWPVVAIWQAHAEQAAGRIDADTLAARLEALPSGEGEHAWVWRQGFHVKVSALDADTWAWMQALAQGACLDEAFDALEQAQRPFDFAAWLERAVREGWLRRFRLR